MRNNTTYNKGLITWTGLASSAEVTFIPVLHEKGKSGAAIFIYSTSMISGYPCSVSRLVYSPRRPANVGKFPLGFPVSQHWDPS